MTDMKWIQKGGMHSGNSLKDSNGWNEQYLNKLVHYGLNFYSFPCIMVYYQMYAILV